MMPAEESRPEVSPAVGGRASRASSPQGVRETTGEIIRGLWRLCLIILAAFMGAMAVEAARAIF